MNLENEREERARRADDDPNASGSEKPAEESRAAGRKGDKAEGSRKGRIPARDIGESLKTVYQRTVNEDIPPEMLDLLGKLG